MKPKLPARAAMWLGHYNNWIFIVTLGVVLTDDLIPGSNIWWNLLESVLWLLAILSWVSEFYHDRHLCRRCFSEPPSEDPDRVVKQHERELKFYHASRLRLLFDVAVLSIIGASLSKYFVDSSRSSVLSVPLDILAILLYGYSCYAEATHRRLDTWCKHCLKA